MGEISTCDWCTRRHTTADCPMCEDCWVTWQPRGGYAGSWPCPLCGLDAGERRARRAVMTLGGAEVYRREWRRAHGLPEVAADR